MDTPGKIIAIGLNYYDHCRETGIEAPKVPLIFAKYSSSIIGPYDEIKWSTRVTEHVDYEAELSVIIGTQCRNVVTGQSVGTCVCLLCGK